MLEYVTTRFYSEQPCITVTRVLTGRLSNELHPGGYLLAAKERRDENLQELNVRIKYL